MLNRNSSVVLLAILNKLPYYPISVIHNNICSRNTIRCYGARDIAAHDAALPTLEGTIIIGKIVAYGTLAISAGIGIQNHNWWLTGTSVAVAIARLIYDLQRA